MLNKQKHGDEMIDLSYNGGIAMDKDTMKLCPCTGMECIKCYFYGGNYQRLTEYDSKYFIPEDSADNGVVLLRSNFEEIVIPYVENSEICEKFNRLVELEDKIEKGELVFKENL